MCDRWKMTRSFPFCMFPPSFNFEEENSSKKFLVLFFFFFFLVEKEWLALRNSGTKMSVFCYFIDYHYYQWSLEAVATLSLILIPR